MTSQDPRTPQPLFFRTTSFPLTLQRQQRWKIIWVLSFPLPFVNTFWHNMAMDKIEAKKRIEVLRREIDENRYLYHVKDKPRVSDAIDDSLKRELAKLEDDYPEFVTADSPTQRVGGRALEKFKKVSHEVAMLSLNDAFSKEDLEKWQDRLIKLVGPSKVESSGYFCELKMDGLAVSLVYEDGILVQGSTRGDGKVGEDVTQNLKTIESIPLRLRSSDSFKRLEIRGEVYLPTKDFLKLNEVQKSSGGQIYANPRNIAAGSIRQLDSKITAGRNLKFIMYAIATENNLKHHSEEHELAKKSGFYVGEHNKLCKNLNEVIDYLKHWEKAKANLPFWTDGVVVTVNDKNVLKQLGVVGKAPRGQIAYKFAAEEATSVVRDIVVQVGRTGKLTPVALLDPTLVAGSTVSRATLHNANEIKRKDIRIGDTVVIHKAGDVIPEVKEVIKRMRAGNEKRFAMPKSCPICGGKVVKKEGQVDWYCAGRNCITRRRRQIEHFVSKGAFEIDGLGPKIIGKLIEEGLVKDAADLYTIKIENIEPLERFAQKSAQNIVDSIESKKEVSLDRFIYALGIRHIGSQMAIDFAKHFGTLEKFVKSGGGEFRMYGVGIEVTNSLIDYLSDKKNLDFISKLEKFGVKIKNYHSPIIQNKLKGQAFVVSGKLDTLTREEAHKKIVQYGGDVSSSVSSKTNFLVVGDEPGSKLEKAKKVGVKILDEKMFLSLIS